MALNETLDLVDAALLLDSLADAVILADNARPDDAIPEERIQVIDACQRAAQLVFRASGSTQPFSAAKNYSGEEIRNAVLRSLFGLDGSAELLGL